jgi:NAD(P)-dependent dehydrogenase (short-subunit alcohol dehydrogenase family)
VALATPLGCGESPTDDVTCFEATLGSEAEVDSLFESLLARFPSLDVVIAVLAPEPLAALHDVSAERWSCAVVDPLRQVFWLVRRAAEEFLAAGAAGRLVLVVEPAPAGSERNEVVEEGLRSFARSFAREYGRRALTCNLVLPVRSAPAARPPGPDPLRVIVEHTLFLASADASFVSGETLLVELTPDG